MAVPDHFDSCVALESFIVALIFCLIETLVFLRTSSYFVQIDLQKIVSFIALQTLSFSLRFNSSQTEVCSSSVKWLQIRATTI